MSTADFLEQQAAWDRDEGQRLIYVIEKREAELVNLRADRDDLFRRAAEMLTAVRILRDIGLRSSMLNNAPLIEVDYQPTRPTGGPDATS